MTPRQRYALTHPIDEAHMFRFDTCKRIRQVDERRWSTTILAVDR